jgi:hypothetical protein
MARFIMSLILFAAAVCCLDAETIFNAPSIAVIRIKTASAGPWSFLQPSERQRVVELDVLVERVFRGSLRTGAKLKIEAEQHEPVARDFAVPGPWSGKTLESGSRYLIFLRNHSETLRVADVDEAAGVELALSFENHRWPLSDLERHAGAKRHLLGHLFAEYLNSKLPAAVSQDNQQWNSILSFLEAPGLKPAFRVEASIAAMDAVLMSSPAPDAIIQRTVIMAFRLLSLPDQNGFHNRVVVSYLPNLLGHEGSEPKRSASRIFAEYPGDRERAVNTLEQIPYSDARNFLKDWLTK